MLTKEGAPCRLVYVRVAYFFVVVVIIRRMRKRLRVSIAVFKLGLLYLFLDACYDRDTAPFFRRVLR